MANAWDLHIFGNVWCPKSQANQTYQWWWVDITFAQDRVFSTSYIYNRNVFIYEPCMPPCNSHRRFQRASWKALLRRLGVESVVTTERYQNAQNQSCFKGSRSLKGTQVYPKEFGRCVPSWDLNSWHSQKYTNYRVYIYLYIPLQPWPFEVARCYDLYAQQHNLDPARSLVDYSHDPWHDARILLCV